MIGAGSCGRPCAIRLATAGQLASNENVSRASAAAVGTSDVRSGRAETAVAPSGRPVYPTAMTEDVDTRRPGWAIRLPFFYGWLLVAVGFVTMAVGVNARTAFSLLFPPILDEFGWERGVTAGAFSFGFLVSALVTPCVGRLTDRYGPLPVDRERRRADGRGAAARHAGARAVAALPDPGRAGRRRGQLPRLYRAVAVSDQLVRAAARAGAQHRLFRCRARLGRPCCRGCKA